MKTTLLLAIVAAAGLNITSQVQADDVLLSPKAAQLRHEFRKVSSRASDVLDRSVSAIGSARGAALAHDLRKGTGKTQDSIVRRPPSASPRGLANEPWRLQQIPIAPLK